MALRRSCKRKTNYVGQGVKVVSGSVKYDSYGNILEDTRVFAPNDVATSYEAYTKITSHGMVVKEFRTFMT